MSRMSRTPRALAALAGALLSTSSLLAQPSITAVTSYNTTAGGDAIGGWLTNTQGGDFYSNTYITQGTNPTTDAFLFNGNTSGALLGSGLSLGAGSYTFYLWGFTGYQVNHGVSLAFDGQATPQIASWYNSTTSTNSALGLTTKDDLGNTVAGVGLSALFGDYLVSITNFSFEQVTRDVLINSYSWSEATSPISHNVGRLELQVRRTGGEPPVSVPEPSALAMMATAMLGLAVRAERRRRVR
jgi:hypothetical protein